MIEHVCTKISKVSNRDKVQQRKEVFITFLKPQVLLAYFKQTVKARTQLAKWKAKVSNDDTVIHVVNQMYEKNWFSEETMTKWEKINDNDKTWLRCQKFFEDAYKARERYNEAKVQMQDIINKITDTEWNLYMEAIEAKVQQDKKEHNNHIQ